MGVRVTITNNGFMRPFRLNRIVNLTDIMLSTFAYSNLTTVFISHHLRFPSHMTLQNTHLKRTVEVEDHISSYLVRSLAAPSSFLMTQIISSSNGYRYCQCDLSAHVCSFCVLITLLLFVAADEAAAAVKQSIPGNQIRKVK